MDPVQTTATPFSRKNLVLYFLRLGTTGFGGPIALVGYMERDLVTERGWITSEEYRRGLALAQLAPGPLAAQLAIYIGYVKGKVPGATVAGLAFILPSFLMVVGIGMLYVAYGGLEWMQAVFYGVGAAVIGIIIRSAYNLVRRTLKSTVLLWAIFFVMGVVTAFTQEEIVWLFLLSGAAAVLILAPPDFVRFSSAKTILPPALLSFVQASVFSQIGLLATIFLFFAKAGAFVFGSGLAIVPFLYAGVVQQHHWLNDRQFLDAVAVAMITPGPVVITVGFVGYLTAGFTGALAAALGVFLPVYLFVIIPAPYVERYARNAQLIAFVDGVTAAATGAIAGAVVVLGRRDITDIPTLLIAIVALATLVRFRIPEPIVVVLAAGIGLLIHSSH